MRERKSYKKLIQNQVFKFKTFFSFKSCCILRGKQVSAVITMAYTQSGRERERVAAVGVRIRHATSNGMMMKNSNIWPKSEAEGKKKSFAFSAHFLAFINFSDSLQENFGSWRKVLVFKLI